MGASREARRVALVARAASGVVLGVGTIVTAAWLLDIDAFKSVVPGLATMKFNTALGFVLLGAALWIQTRRLPSPALARGLGFAVAGLATLTLIECGAGRSLGIDQLIVADPRTRVSPGRMSTATALNFLLLGLAVAVSGWRSRLSRRAADGLGAAAGLIALVAVVGYLYDVESLYRVAPFSSMAIHTAVGFGLACVAVIFSDPTDGLARVLADTGPVGVLMRRLLPAAVVVPIAVGWARLKGERSGLYAMEFGLTLHTVANIIITVGVVWWTADALRRSDRARTRAEDEVRAREVDLATTLDSIGDGVIATNERGEVTRMNPVAERFTGVSATDARGQRLRDVYVLVDESTGENLECPVDRVLEDGEPLELSNHAAIVSRDGGQRAVAHSAAPIRAEGHTKGAVVVFRDTTDIRARERALRETQARFSRLYESGVVGIVIADRDGSIREANDAFLEIVGYSRDELCGSEKSLLDLTPDNHEQQTLASMERLAEQGMVEGWEKEYLRKDNSRVPVLVGSARLHDERIMSFIADLTQQRRAERETAGRERAERALRETEEQLRQAQKMEAIGILAGGIAHDFNNLLSAILTFSTMLRDDLPDRDPLRQDAEEIISAAQRATDLTRQLLAFSRQQVLQPRQLDLNELVDGLSKMLRRLLGEDVTLTVAPSDKLGKVLADPGQLEQVIMNLAVNARDAMPRGGKLTIETQNTVLDGDYAREHLSVEPGKYVMLSISDTGTGMDKATQTRIFEPFFTTKEKGRGTGLGLATAFGIVKQSGGSIWVCSEKGQGSTFKIYLPESASHESAAAVGLERVEKNDLRGSETILLVEDDGQVRRAALTILRRHGYRAIEAAGAGDALVLFERHAKEIALVVTDVVMPHMSGRELAERILALRPEIPILYMSGYTDDAVVRHGVLAADLAFIQKPLTPRALLRRVRELLDGTARPSPDSRRSGA
jgi:PAS domain S-box-containing protein